MAALIRIVDRAGAPVEGAAVTVVSGAGAYPEMTLLSQSDGSVRMSLPPGTFRVAALHGQRRAEADVSDTGETHIVLE